MFKPGDKVVIKGHVPIRNGSSIWDGVGMKAVVLEFNETFKTYLVHIGEIRTKTNLEEYYLELEEIYTSPLYAALKEEE